MDNLKKLEMQENKINEITEEDFKGEYNYEFNESIFSVALWLSTNLTSL